MNVTKPVGLIHRGVDRIGIDAVLYPWREVARDDRRTSNAMRPRYRFSLCVQSCAQAVIVIRAIHIVLDVFLPRPDYLDRSLHLLGNLHGPHRAVELEAAAEPATEQMIVDTDLLPLQSGDFHYGRLRETRNLCADPDVAAVRGHAHSAVHRLHRRVRKKGLLVNSVNFLRGPCDGCGCVAVMTRDSSGPFRRGGEPG